MDSIHSEAARALEEGRSCVLVTVAEKQGEGPAAAGKKMLLFPDGSMKGTVGGGALEYTAIEKAREILKTRQQALISYVLDEGKTVPEHETVPMICGGKVTLLYEWLSPGDDLFIFGGGHVGRAIARQFSALHFYLHIIEDRDDVYKEIDFGDARYHCSFREFIKDAAVTDESYVIVCTPSHTNDYEVVEGLLERGIRPRYIGMLASQGKKEDFLGRIHSTFTKEVDLENFYCPVGLDTGGPSPEEIAVSVAAEILAVKYNRKGHRHMRDL